MGELMDKSKLLVSLVVVFGGGLAAYFYFKSQCQTSPASYPTVCGWLGVTAPATTTAAAPAGSTPAVAPTQAGTPVPAQSPVTAAAYTQAIAAMKATAASDSQNFGAWSYYFQNAPTFAGAPTGFGQTGGISPNLYGAIVQLGGGDDTKIITAEQFVAYYQQAMQNAGLSGFEIPTWLIHRGAYA
jgi:hypothetical protein